MTDTNVFQLTQPGTFADPLTEVLRNGARALLAQAVESTDWTGRGSMHRTFPGQRRRREAVTN